MSGATYAQSYPDDWDDPILLVEPDSAPPLASRPSLEPAASPPPPALALALAEPRAGGASMVAAAPEDHAAASQPIAAPSTEIDTDASAATQAPAPSGATPFPQRSFGVPALMSRSALFSAGEGKEEQSQTKRLIASHGTYTVHLEGPRLTMRDKAVWEQVVAMAWKRGHFGEFFPVSLGGIHKAVMGTKRSPSQRELDLVAKRILRLSQARVFYTAQAGERGEAQLISGIKRVATGKPGRERERWEVEFDAGFEPLFRVDALCQIQPPVEGGRPSELALWLRDYLGSNKAFNYKVPTLRRLCGYEAGNDKFTTGLRAAMELLAAECPASVAKWELRDESPDSADWTLAVSPAADPSVKVSKAAMAKKTAAKAATSAQNVAPAVTETKPRKTTKRNGGVAL